MPIVIAVIVLIGLVAGADAVRRSAMPFDFGALVVAVFLTALAFLVGGMLAPAPKKSEELEQEYANRQIERNAKKLDVLQRIGQPVHNGRYSDADMSLWNLYHKLDAEDACLTKLERDEVIELEMRRK